MLKGLFEIKNENEIKFYIKDEVSNLFKLNERLFYFDDRVFEAIDRYRDLSNIIVDLTLNYDVDSLRVYNYKGGYLIFFLVF